MSCSQFLLCAPASTRGAERRLHPASRPGLQALCPRVTVQPAKPNAVTGRGWGGEDAGSAWDNRRPADGRARRGWRLPLSGPARGQHRDPHAPLQ